MNFFKTVLFIVFCAVYCMAGYSFESPIVRRLPKPDVKLTQGDVRVLVVLVEFADVRFKNPDPVSQFTDYLNKEYCFKIEIITRDWREGLLQRAIWL